MIEASCVSEKKRNAITRRGEPKTNQMESIDTSKARVSLFVTQNSNNFFHPFLALR